MKQPLVSIIIVNYNGLKWLDQCLTSIYSQTYKHIEVIFVDNNSVDDSVQFIKNNFSKVNVIISNDNLGFAGGNNLGVSQAKGSYYFLLNNDTNLIDPNLISECIKYMESKPQVAVLQPKICLLASPDKLDLCGAFWTNTTVLYHYGFFQDQAKPKFNKIMPVFTVKGAAMFVKKHIVEKVGLFDDTFWCYYEETDFCHKVWLTGNECEYFPKVKLLHSNAGTSSVFNGSYIQFHNFKNKLRSFIKNFDGIELFFVLIKFLLVSIIYSLISILTFKFSNVYAVFKAYIWNIKNIHSTLEGKSKFHHKLPTSIVRNPSWLYYFYLIFDLSKYKQ